MNALGMSTVITSRSSCASITHVLQIASKDAVGLAVFSRDNQSLVSLPLNTHLPLMVPSFFSANSIIASTAFCFSEGVIFPTSMGFQQFLSTSCFSSFMAAFHGRFVATISKYLQSFGDIVLLDEGYSVTTCDSSLDLLDHLRDKYRAFFTVFGLSTFSCLLKN